MTGIQRETANRSIESITRNNFSQYALGELDFPLVIRHLKQPAFVVHRADELPDDFDLDIDSLWSYIRADISRTVFDELKVPCTIRVSQRVAFVMLPYDAAQL